MNDPSRFAILIECILLLIAIGFIAWMAPTW